MAKALVWKTFAEMSRASNIRRFMKEHGIATYKDLIRRSTSDIAWFWDAAIRDLGIEFFRPYKKTLNTSRGIQWATWFDGGRINIAHNCLDKHALSHRRNKIACVWEGEDGAVRKLTYYDLYVETNRLSHALKDLGVRKGDAVGVYMPMIPEAVAALLSIAKLGAIFIPIFSGYGAQAMASRLQDCHARVLLTADGFFRKGSVVHMKQTADEAADLCPSIKNVVVLKRIGSPIPWNPRRDIWWDEAVRGAARRYPTEITDSEDPYMIAYTSGTTGRPKGSVHVHGGFLVKIAEEVAYQFDLKDEDILFWVTDMGWIMGPWEVVGALALGGTIFLYEGAPDYPAPDRLWTMIERHGITILGISPTAVRALMRHSDEFVTRHDLSTLRILGSTGEPWNPGPWRWYFDKVGGRRCPIINISGGTEVAACFLSPLPITPLKPCSLVGPSPGMDMDVFDEKGRPVRGKVGELVVKKPWPGMTRGIWGDPKRYMETYWSRWTDVWVHGDWASIDRDGYWFLHGRSDDTIKIAGKRLGPAEAESILVSHPAVSESAAIGVPDEVKGEAVVCFVVLKPGNDPSEALTDELKALVARQLGKPMAPKGIRCVRDLPKTRNGKIMRRLIRARFLGQEVGDTSSLENPDALEEIARSR